MRSATSVSTGSSEAFMSRLPVDIFWVMSVTWLVALSR